MVARRKDPAPLPGRASLRLWSALGIYCAALALLIGYEAIVLGWHLAREEIPGLSIWHCVRAGIAAGLSVWLVTLLVDVGKRTTDSDALAPAAIRIGTVSLVTGIGATGLFLASPEVFRTGASEDGAMEWLTALWLAVAFVFTAAAAWRNASVRAAADRWRLVHLIVLSGLALLFLLILMEEISWGQRIFHFATPEPIAERNWQGEFNLHNFQTDISELALYFCTGIFLLLLPLMRETVGGWRVLTPFHAVLPDRAAAAAGAPMLMLTYSHWDLLPIQGAFWIGLAVCAMFALRAVDRGWRNEALLFGALTAAIAIGQVVFLIQGDRMHNIFDSSEYREFFIGLGFAVYGWRQWTQHASAPHRPSGG